MTACNWNTEKWGDTLTGQMNQDALMLLHKCDTVLYSVTLHGNEHTSACTIISLGNTFKEFNATISQLFLTYIQLLSVSVAFSATPGKIPASFLIHWQYLWFLPFSDECDKYAVCEGGWVRPQERL